mmetsp:Transcript_9818/g.12886  ORF Transcript_9818/g.12886 Transcript_9818/m.12886 type:complete len:143 (-) Transcript_9818:133-561(-)
METTVVQFLKDGHWVSMNQLTAGNLLDVSDVALSLHTVSLKNLCDLVHQVEHTPEVGMANINVCVGKNSNNEEVFFDFKFRRIKQLSQSPAEGFLVPPQATNTPPVVQQAIMMSGVGGVKMNQAIYDRNMDESSDPNLQAEV